MLILSHADQICSVLQYLQVRTNCFPVHLVTLSLPQFTAVHHNKITPASRLVWRWLLRNRQS